MIGLLTIICNGNEYAGMAVSGETHEMILSEFLELPYDIPSPNLYR